MLNYVNQINSAMVDGIKNSKTLIEQSRILTSIKPAAAIALHGVAGPGMEIAAAAGSMVSGEKSFGKAVNDYVADTKKFQLYGEVAAQTFEKLGKTTLQNSEKFGKATQSIAKHIRDFTSTPKMMDDSIKALAGRTGLLAKSFTGLATGLKVATGHIGTALMVATAAYDQFIKRWMDNSRKLKEDIELLKGSWADVGSHGWFTDFGSAGSTRAGMNRWTQRGGTRQEFLKLLDQSSGMLSGNINQRQATSLMELAKIRAGNEGKNVSEEYNKLLKNFYVRGTEGSTPEKLEQERLRMRVVEGGRRTGVGFKGPLQRYREWSEDVGTKLNNATEGWSPSEIIQGLALTHQGRVWKGFKEGVTGAANWGMDAILGARQLPGAFGGLSVKDFGKIISGGAGLLEKGSAAWDTAAGENRIKLGEALESNRLPGFLSKFLTETFGQGPQLQFQGAVQMLSGSRKKLLIDAQKDEKELARLENETEDKKQLLTAYEMGQEFKKANPKMVSEVREIAKKMRNAQTPEELEKAKDAIGDIAAKTGKEFNEIMEYIKALDNSGKDILKTAKQVEQIKKQIEEREKEIKERRIKIGQREELIESSGNVDLSDPYYSMKALQDGRASVLERAMINRQKNRSQTEEDLRKLVASGKKYIERGGIKFTTPQLKKKLADIAEEEGNEKSVYNEMLRAFLVKRAEFDLKQKEVGLEIANKQLPTAIESARKRGLLSKDDLKRLGEIPDKDTGKYGTLEAQEVQMILKKAEAEQNAEFQKFANNYIYREMGTQGMTIGSGAKRLLAGGGISRPDYEEIQKLLKEKTEFATKKAAKILNVSGDRFNAKLQQVDDKFIDQELAIRQKGMGVTAQGLVSRGEMGEGIKNKIQRLIKQGDEESLRHAQKILELTQQRLQLEKMILQTKTDAIQKEGTTESTKLGLVSNLRKGITGSETTLIQQILGSGNKRLINESQQTMQQILSIRQNMYKQEIDFTLKYAQTKMQIIETHYNNLNQLEQGRLTQLDRRYQPHLQYGQAVFGLQGTMTQAQMGRYAGEDYRRQQARTERGMREQLQETLWGAAGYQAPRELQITRALRSSREAQEDVRRSQRREKEADTLQIQGTINTQEALRKQLGGLGQLKQFYQSEGGRQFLMQMLQQTQGAFSRQGIDVSGRIQKLAQEQQVMEAKKLAVSLRIRDRETISIEKQIKTMEAEVGKLPEGSKRAQEVKMTLAEQYKRLSGQYLSVGKIDEAEKASKKQEQLLKSVPQEMKRDFGDVVKQQLNELKTHTNVLKAIRDVLSKQKTTAKTEGISESKKEKSPQPVSAASQGKLGQVGAPVPQPVSAATVQSPKQRPHQLSAAEGETDKRNVSPTAQRIPLSEIDHRAPAGTGNLYATDLAKREGRELTKDEKVKQGFLASSLQRARYISDVKHMFPYMPGRHPFDKDSWRAPSVFEGGVGFNIAPNTPGSEGYVNRNAIGDIGVQERGGDAELAKRVSDKAFQREMEWAEKQPNKKVWDEGKFASAETVRRDKYKMELADRRAKTLDGLSKRASKIEDENPQLAEKAKQSLYQKVSQWDLRRNYIESLKKEGWNQEATTFIRPDKSTYESSVFRKGAQTMAMDQDQIDRAALYWRRNRGNTETEKEDQKNKTSIDKFADGSDKILKAAEKLANVEVKVRVEGNGSGSASSRPGEYGSY